MPKDELGGLPVIDTDESEEITVAEKMPLQVICASSAASMMRGYQSARY
jgi:hypothetical protein